MRRMRLDQAGDSAGDATNFGTLHFSEFRRLLENLRILREAREARTPRYLVVEFGTQLYFSMAITVTSLRVYSLARHCPCSSERFPLQGIQELTPVRRKKLRVGRKYALSPASAHHASKPPFTSIQRHSESP